MKHEKGTTRENERDPLQEAETGNADPDCGEDPGGVLGTLGAILSLLLFVVFVAGCIWFLVALHDASVHDKEAWEKEKAAYAELETRYGIDGLAEIRWDRISPLPERKQLYEGWGYDEGGTPVLYYMEKPASPLADCDLDDVRIYEKPQEPPLMPIETRNDAHTRGEDGAPEEQGEARNDAQMLPQDG